MITEQEAGKVAKRPRPAVGVRMDDKIKAKIEIDKILSIYPHGIGRGGELLDRLVCCVADMLRAAYADGLEAAAKITESTFPYIATDEERFAFHQLSRATERIKRQAKETRDE